VGQPVAATVLVFVQTVNGIWYGPRSFFPVYLRSSSVGPEVIGILVSGALVRHVVAVFAVRSSYAGQQVGAGLRPGAFFPRGGAAAAFLARAPWIVAAPWFAGGAD